VQAAVAQSGAQLGWESVSDALPAPRVRLLDAQPGPASALVSSADTADPTPPPLPTQELKTEAKAPVPFQQAGAGKQWFVRHLVKKNDTLISLSVWYDSSPHEIKICNRSICSEYLDTHVGQLILVPVGSGYDLNQPNEAPKMVPASVNDEGTVIPIFFLLNPECCTEKRRNDFLAKTVGKYYTGSRQEANFYLADAENDVEKAFSNWLGDQQWEEANPYPKQNDHVKYKKIEKPQRPIEMPKEKFDAACCFKLLL
jgi:hypothetical protein